MESSPTQTPTTPLTSLKQLLGIRTQDTTILEPILTSDTSAKGDYQRWNNEVSEEDVLAMKYPSLSMIDWNVLARVDTQMEEALGQCKQDFIQYDQFSLPFLEI